MEKEKDPGPMTLVFYSRGLLLLNIFRYGFDGQVVAVHHA